MRMVLFNPPDLSLSGAFPLQSLFPKPRAPGYIISVDPADEQALAERVSNQRVVLRDWLISHLSKQSVADMVGEKGHNQLRAEIKREFNRLL